MTTMTVAGLVAMPVLIWLAVTDWRTRTLPMRAIGWLWVPVAVAGVSWATVAVAVTVLVLGLVVAIVAPRLLAGGDVKLAAALSLLVGAPLTVPMLMAATVFGGAAALTVHRRGDVPLGTYLCASTALALVGGLGWLNL